MAIVIHEERCKGCGYCVETCKKGALSFSEKMNAQGIVYVQADEEKCVGCGMCYTICPDIVFEIN